MKLLVVESPAKAKTIGKYLGKEFEVISSYGHVRSIPSKNGAVLPEKDFAMTYEVNDKAKKRVSEIASKVKVADEILLATDPDREGEAISWHLLEVIKKKKALKKTVPVKRVVFNEITKKAVLSAVANPRDIDENLVQAQQARQALDYLVGFNISPVLWRKLPGSRSVGRVQSVALRAVCQREKEIEDFKIREYWTIEADFTNAKKVSFKAELAVLDSKKLEKFDIENEKAAKKVVASLPKEGLKVIDLSKKQLKKNPAPPFATSSMLQEASRKLGFSAKKTSLIAQRLYEGIAIGKETLGLVTYIRTDSVTVAQDALNEASQYIKTNYGDKYALSAPRVFKTKAKNTQEAHEAIRPTSLARTPESIAAHLDSDQLKLYSLIWKRMVASQMQQAILESLTIDISTDAKENIFKARGSTVLFDGFYRVYKEGKDDEKTEGGEQKLPDLQKDEDLDLKKLSPIQHFTQPPTRYTEASLVKMMEEVGIGRPSTYPTILSILLDRKYVRAEKKRFIPEARGRLVNAFLTEFFSKYVEYQFTADLENNLDEVASGAKNFKDLLGNFWDPFKKNVDETLEIKTKDVLDSIEGKLINFIFPPQDEGEDLEKLRKCPKCKEGVLGLRNSRYGPFIACSGYPECDYKKPFGSNAEDSLSQEGASEYPKHICINDKTGAAILLKKGPYGMYLESEGEGRGKPKRISLPKSVDPSNVDIKLANKLMNLPYILGKHPKTSLDVTLKTGRYGPYIEHDKKFAAIRKPLSIETIDLDSALELLAKKK